MKHRVALAREKRAQWETRFRRELAEALAVDLVRDEHGTLFLRQLVERGLELLEKDGPRVNRLRSGVRRREKVFERADSFTLLAARARPGHCRCQRHRLLLSKPIDDAIARHSKNPGAGPLDGLHQAVCLDQLEEDVLQHVLRVDLGHALPDEAEQPALLALDRLGDLPVLIGHDLFEDQDSPLSSIQTDEGSEYCGARWELPAPSTVLVFIEIPEEPNDANDECEGRRVRLSPLYRGLVDRGYPVRPGIERRWRRRETREHRRARVPDAHGDPADARRLLLRPGARRDALFDYARPGPRPRASCPVLTDGRRSSSADGFV